MQVRALQVCGRRRSAAGTHRLLHGGGAPLAGSHELRQHVRRTAETVETVPEKPLPPFRARPASSSAETQDESANCIAKTKRLGDSPYAL